MSYLQQDGMSWLCHEGGSGYHREECLEREGSSSVIMWRGGPTHESFYTSQFQKVVFYMKKRFGARALVIPLSSWDLAEDARRPMTLKKLVAPLVGLQCFCFLGEVAILLSLSRKQDDSLGLAEGFDSF